MEHSMHAYMYILGSDKIRVLYILRSGDGRQLNLRVPAVRTA
jgi:hypothetical protein